MKKQRTWLLVVGIVLIGANLRLPITMMPPLLPRLVASGLLPQALAGLVTSLPLLVFALVSPLFGRLGSQHGSGRILWGAAVLLVAGSGLRLLPSGWALLAGTLLVGLGIAAGNVLLPALIKAEFPRRIAVMTTVYTTAMGLVASLGTGTAGLLAQHVGVTATEAVLGSVSVLALLVWTLVLPRLTGPRGGGVQARLRVGRYPMAWLVAAFFGLQSILYYTLLTWLPTIWQAAGFDAVAAGSLATLFQLSGLPLTMLTPSLAERRHGLVGLVIFVTAGFGLGLLGVLAGPASFGFQAVAAVVAGTASGAAFSLCIVFFQQKTASPRATAALSGMAQASGYLLAAAGPLGCAWLGQRLGWAPVLELCLGLTVLLGGFGGLVLRGPKIQA
ncbi:MFS transporter [Lacticaseibacillus suihuaensis]